LKTVYLSLGSNMGDREARLQEAMERLEAAGMRIPRRSSIYETEPQDLPDQPWFLNMVVEVETELFPRQLLAQTQKIEREMGRKRDVPKGPRTIDIDILLCGDSTLATKELQIPHPRLAQRRFVLEPLAELASDLRLPGSNSTVRELLQSSILQAIQGQIVRRWR
jgi:2-amino-4-hydroxy-6-hydroxymethyldihydropteridine diphosphokinase